MWESTPPSESQDASSKSPFQLPRPSLTAILHEAQLLKITFSQPSDCSFLFLLYMLPLYYNHLSIAKYFILPHTLLLLSSEYLLSSYYLLGILIGTQYSKVNTKLPYPQKVCSLVLERETSRHKNRSTFPPYNKLVCTYLEENFFLVANFLISLVCSMTSNGSILPK